jgi:uncharacterized 2Fe-2S/4Fe-4S cluster protein (DUF4445 family)
MRPTVPVVAAKVAAGAVASSHAVIVGADMSHRVVFTPSGLDSVVEPGVAVLDVARRLGADLDTVCGGRGICGRCQVTVSEGSFAKWGITSQASSLGPLASIETDYRGNRPLQPNHRLGCAATICGDVVIDIPAASQVHRQVVRKDLALGDVELDPRYSLCYIEVAVRELGDGVTAVGSIVDALSEQHGRTIARTEHGVLVAAHHALHRGEGGVTAALRMDAADTGVDCTLVAVWPGYVGSAYGIAVDIGSTTVAGHLCDLFTGEVLSSAGRMNPQIRFGEDLMSRVSFVMMNPGGDLQLTAAIRTALDELAGELCAAAQVARTAVLDVVLVGNPIMHHIVLGIDPTPLGTAPFVLATDRATTVPAAALDLTLPNAQVYVGPCIAGHVGADTTAAILAEGPHRSDHTQLLVDIGTNAEIVLGTTAAQFAASSPTGPAFEGAQISCGQRATAGAIEKVRIDPVTLESRLKVIGCDAWSNEPGFDPPVVSGICGSGIIDVMAEMYLAGIIDADGVVQGALAGRTPRIVADGRTFTYVLHGDPAFVGSDGVVSVTQNDVRAIQLAKAALRAGIDLLMRHAGVTEVADVRLAGAFGAHIDPLRAMVIGLVPDGPIDGVRAVGNAAGVGAAQALLSQRKRSEMETAAQQVTKIETATEPGFQQLFVEAMAFPHATVATPHLATLVELPVRAARADASAQRARRRRDRTSIEGDLS